MLFFVNVLGLQYSNIGGPKREVDLSMLRVRQTALYLQQKSFGRQAKAYNQKKVGGAGLHLWLNDSRRRYQFVTILISYEKF